MKIQNRQARIVEIVLRQKQASVEDLAQLMEVSRETIRRDLADLADQGKIQKVHGGAVIPRLLGEGPFQQRMGENAGAKLRIARKAAALFRSGETIFIDTGSTTLFLARELGGVSGLTVITNSAAIAKAVCASKGGNSVFLLGGEFNAGNEQTIGTMAEAQIGAFRAHHCVLTIGALDGSSGVMDFNIAEARIARAMIGQSRSLTILADSSKFDALASFEVCPLARIDRLVCEAPPTGSLGQALSAAGVEILTAPEAA